MRRPWTNRLVALLLGLLIAPAAQAQLNITVEEIGQFGSTPDSITFFDDMAIVGTTLLPPGKTCFGTPSARMDRFPNQRHSLRPWRRIRSQPTGPTCS